MFDKLQNIDMNVVIDSYIIPWGINGFQALIVFFVGKWLANKMADLIGVALEHSGMDDMLVNFIESILSWVLLFVVVIAALGQLGVNTTSLLALLGAAGLAVGLALKDSLSNFAAGVMLLIFRPFRIGDYVDVSGVEGVVEKMHVFTTTITTLDNKENIIPNSNIYGGVIVNYTSKENRRVDMTFGISYDDDIKKAKEVMLNVLKSHEKVLEEPEPVVMVSELADSSVNFTVRPWVKAADYWPVYFDCQERVKIALDEADITIPFPQRDVHLNNVD